MSLQSKRNPIQSTRLSLFGAESANKVAIYSTTKLIHFYQHYINVSTIFKHNSGSRIRFTEVLWQLWQEFHDPGAIIPKVVNSFTISSTLRWSFINHLMQDIAQLITASGGFHKWPPSQFWGEILIKILSSVPLQIIISFGPWFTNFQTNIPPRDGNLRILIQYPVSYPLKNFHALFCEL